MLDWGMQRNTSSKMFAATTLRLHLLLSTIRVGLALSALPLKEGASTRGARLST